MRRPGRTSWLVLLMGLVATVIGVAFVYFTAQTRDQRELDARAADVAAALHERLELYESTLFATRSFFQTFPGEMTDEAFADYVDGLRLEKRLPGILGIGFARLVKPDEALSFEEKMRRKGNPMWRIWPQSASEPMFPIVMLKPDAASVHRLSGFNMFSEIRRRKAMQRAWETGEATMSGPFSLGKKRTSSPSLGFLIFASVASPDEGHTPDAFVGFVYASFHVRDFLFDALADTRAKDLRIKVYDGAIPTTDRLMYETDDSKCEGPHALAVTQVGGRVWGVQVAPGASFAGGSPPGLPFTVAIVGLLATGLLFVTSRTQERERRLVENEARRSTFVAEAATRLGTSLEQSETLVALVRLLVPELAERGIVAAHCGSEFLVATVAHRQADVTFERRNANEGGGLPALARRAIEQNAEVCEGESMAAPLVARGRTIGVVFLERPVRDGPVTIDECVNFAATWVDNARLYALAQRDVALREEFLSVASHEVRAPLASLKLQVDSTARKLRAGTLTPERLAHSIAVVERQTNRVVALVEGLFDVQRLAHKKMQLHWERVDLQALALEVAQRLEAAVVEAGCELEVLPGDPVVGVWDGFRLEQVLTNLLSNAVKYGNGRPVSVRVSRCEEGALVEVKDQGIGIAPEEIETVFERFGRASGASAFVGLGLGLYIVRELVEAMGGRVRVESEPGVGSTFSVVLPLNPKEAD